MNIYPKRRRGWIYLSEEVMAKSFLDGKVLMKFEKHGHSKAPVGVEIIDMQRYKVYHKPQTIRAMLVNRKNWEPFVFPAYIN